jgi:RND family efflux transporter MFP subunit
VKLTPLLLSATLLVGCSPSAGEEQQTNPIALVATAKVSTGSVPETITVFGSALPGASGTRIVSAATESLLVSVQTPIGSRVAPGQVIARLRPSSSARLEIARATLEARSASQAYARARRLRSDGLTSDADVETARSSFDAANATLASLRGRAGASVLLSPVEGTVTDVAATPGSVLPAGASVATITSLQAVRARFGIDPGLARQIPKGAFIRISPTKNGPNFSVPVVSVDPIVDSQTRLASVYASVPAQAELGSGEPLRGEIVIPGTGVTDVVPYSALLNDGGQPYVFIVVGGIVHRRNVSLGATSDELAEVLSGVSPGQLVVTEGGTALQDGMRVRTR